MTSVFFFLLKYDSWLSSENGEVSGIESLKKRQKMCKTSGEGGRGD